MIADTAAAADDTQVWATLGASAEVTPGITLNLEEQFRLSDEADLLRQHTDLSVTLGAVANRMTVTLGYRNTSDDEQRPYVGADLRILSDKLTRRQFISWQNRSCCWYKGCWTKSFSFR
jgi:hypothetical protein